MNEHRFVHVEFCDDIRHEIGYKYSLIGCYSGNELVSDVMPVVLPKLFAAIIAQTPIEKPFTKLKFTAYLNDELVAENEIPSDAITPQSVPTSTIPGATPTKHFFRIQMGFVPLVVPFNSVLKITVETEEGIMNGARLIIRQRTEEDLPVQVA